MCGDSTLSNPIKIIPTCISCSVQQSIEIELADYLDWQANGVYLQDAAPYLTVDERELLISGICGSCFNELYKGDDDE